MIRSGLLMLALVFGLSVDVATAREAVLNVDKSCVLSKEGDHRVLVSVGGTELLKNMYINDAHLVVPISDDAIRRHAGTLELQVSAVTRYWDRSADWDVGWERPGGDFDADVYSRVVVKPEELGGVVRIPVATVLREEAGGRDLHGFIVSVVPHRGRGLNESAVRLLDGVANAHVEVSWAPRPPESPMRKRALARP